MAFRVTAILRISTKQWAYNLSGFNRYGLMRDDLLHETDDVKEALRRLKPYLLDERNYRLLRAVQLSGMKRILPREQWTRLEDDVLYLSPIVDQVRIEREEREAWEKEF